MRIDGEIKSKNRTVASVSGGLLTNTNNVLLPLYLKRTGDIEGWLRGRAIDAHRTNSRLLKKALRLAAASDVEITLKVHAATITDTYWFKESGSSLTYEDVRFNANFFDKLALLGNPDSFNLPYSPTPELTNIGSFEKCWRLENGSWWMVKQGNDLERFSELFICRLGQELGFPMANYISENETIVSPDFTSGAAVNYEAAEGIVGDDEDYSVNFEALWNLSPDLVEQYMQIIYMDTLCFNMDRHTKNYGVLRDVENGQILRMAPNFDNNIALFALGVPTDLDRANDKLISLYCEFFEQDNRAFEIAKRLPAPDRKQIEACIDPIALPIDADILLRFVLRGSERIQERISAHNR